MISLNKFKQYKQILEDSIMNRAFRSRMMFEAIHDEMFADIILYYLDKLNSNISAEHLDTMLTEIRKDIIEYYNKSKKEIELLNKTNLMLRSLALFYFLECIDEHSKFSENIIEDIKKKYPNNYLKIISEIDKIYLSVDTKKQVNIVSSKKEIDDDLLKKYLVLKKWQDLQHSLFESGYGKYRIELQEQFCNDKTKSSFDLEQCTLRKRLFDYLKEKKILDLDTCSIISELYIKKFVVKFIGGKMYGLAILNSNGIKVPFSLVIPVGIEVSNKDLKLALNDNLHYCCRSSADIEDGEKNSFAGMFDSYLDVPVNKMIETINKVKKSVNNDRLNEYIRVNGLDEPHMAVVIQPFKEPSYAGVWIGNSEDSGVLEWVEGNGEKLVSGTSTPNHEIWTNGKTKKPLKINGKAIGEQLIEFQKKLGENADFEWMVLDEKLIMLQFRPVTKKVIVEIKRQKENLNGYIGIPASPGITIGQVRYLQVPVEEVVPGKILLAMKTDPDWLPHLINSKGVITAYGGFLCHTAIVCRELGIPCVTGVGEKALEDLINCKKNIQINGTTGDIKIMAQD